MTQITKLAFFAIVAASLFGVGHIAYATQPTAVLGTFDVDILGVPSFEQQGNKCIILLPAQFSLSGDLTGYFSSEFKIIHFGSCIEPAKEHFTTSGTFVGIVGTSSGTFDFTFHGKIDENSIAQGKMMIKKGTDDLENIHGIIELGGLSGVGGTYKGNVHFDP